MMIASIFARLFCSEDELWERGADTAFTQIRQYGRSSAAVTIRMLETMVLILGFVHRPADRHTLALHAAMIARGAREALPEEEGRCIVEERWQAVVALSGGSTGVRN